MARKLPDDLQKHTLNLRAGDFAQLGEMFPKLGASVAVRRIISSVVDKYNESNADKIKLDNLDI